VKEAWVIALKDRTLPQRRSACSGCLDHVAETQRFRVREEVFDMTTAYLFLRGFPEFRVEQVAVVLEEGGAYLRRAE
jgi:hypothetical protein